MQDNTKCRVAIYCRVANAREASEDTAAIQAQVRILRAYAKKLGYLNCTEYLDNGCSGLTMDRPAFVQMCEDIRADMIGAVFVKDIARISRNYLLFHAWMENMRKQGVEVYTPEGKLEDELRPVREHIQALYKQSSE